MALYVRYQPTALGGGGGGGSGGITSINTDTSPAQTLVTASTGSDFTIATVSGVSTFAIPSASASNRGLLTSADWSAFNSKQAAGNYITALTGDGTAAGPGSSILTLSTVNADIGTFGSASAVSTLTVNAKGLVTAASATPIQIAESQVTNLVSDLAGKQPTGNYITDLTGDATASGPGSAALTLATVNANVGAFGSASSVSALTVNAKGLVTAAASTAIQIAESQVTNLVSDLAGKQAAGNYITDLTGDVSASGPGSVGATIGANVVTNAKSAQMATLTIKGNNTGGTANASDLTVAQVNAILPVFTSTLNGLVPLSGGGTTNFLRADGTWAAAGSGTVTSIGMTVPSFLSVTPASITTSGTFAVTLSGTALPIANGGTGQTSANPAFNALSPLTTKGDVLTYGTVNQRHAAPNDYGYLVADSNQTDGWRSSAYGENDGAYYKNLIQYADFENGATTGWAMGTIGTLTNGLPTGSPTFGSGASGNLSISFVTSGNQITDAYSMQIANSGATTAGNMVHTNAYAVDKSLQARVLSFRLNYSVLVQGGMVLSGLSTNGLAIAAYDVTNSAFIPVVGAFNFIQGTGVGVSSGSLQTPYNCASIRFIIYFPNASTGSISVLIDDVYLGGQTTAASNSVVVFSGTRSATQSVTADTTNIAFTATKDTSGAWNGTQFTVPVAGDYYVCASVQDNGTTQDRTDLYVNGARVAFGGQTSAVSPNYACSSYVAPNCKFGDLISIRCNQTTTLGANLNLSIFKIGGNPTSNDSSNVVASVYTLSSTTITANTALQFTTIAVDTAGAITTGAGYKFTVPSAGNYQVGVSSAAGASGGGSFYVAKNGSFTLTAQNFITTLTSSQGCGGSVVIPCNAGDTLQIANNASITGSTLANAYFQKVAGSSVVQAGESVNAYYASSVGTSVTASMTTMPFGTKEWDTNNAYSVNTYTAPVSGKYTVTASIQTATLTLGTAAALTLQAVQAGSQSKTKILGRTNGNGASTTVQAEGTATFNLAAGDTIIIQASSNTTTTLSADPTYNRFEIARIGN